jgi:ABC-type uncharacterized transport system permease subunit
VDTRRILLWVIIVMVLVSFVLYRTRSRTRLNVTPDAERAIEKAKRR